MKLLQYAYFKIISIFFLQLLRKFKTLRGAFKFFDLNHNGFIEETEMKKTLTLLGYNLSNQDFTDIFEVFDLSQRQLLSFENFKKTLLNV